MGCYYPQTVFIYFPTMMPIRINFPRVSVLDKSIKILCGGRAASDQEPNHFTNTTWWRGICQKLMLLLFQRRKKENYYIVTGRQDDRPTTDGHQFPQASRLTTTPSTPKNLIANFFFWGVSKQASKPFQNKRGLTTSTTGIVTCCRYLLLRWNDNNHNN